VWKWKLSSKLKWKAAGIITNQHIKRKRREKRREKSFLRAPGEQLGPNHRKRGAPAGGIGKEGHLQTGGAVRGSKNAKQKDKQVGKKEGTRN